jgi:type IV secretory pathway VirB2 component (pilin)
MQRQAKSWAVTATRIFVSVMSDFGFYVAIIIIAAVGAAILVVPLLRKRPPGDE